jgi:hypothetical protein
VRFTHAHTHTHMHTLIYCFYPTHTHLHTHVQTLAVPILLSLSTHTAHFLSICLSVLRTSLVAYFPKLLFLRDSLCFPPPTPISHIHFPPPWSCSSAKALLSQNYFESKKEIVFFSQLRTPKFHWIKNPIMWKFSVRLMTFQVVSGRKLQSQKKMSHPDFCR